MVFDDVIKFVTVVIKINMNIVITRADSLIVHLNIFFLWAGLIYSEDPVRKILAGKLVVLLIILKKVIYYLDNLKVSRYILKPPHKSSC